MRRGQAVAADAPAPGRLRRVPAGASFLTSVLAAPALEESCTVLEGSARRLLGAAPAAPPAPAPDRRVALIDAGSSGGAALSPLLSAAGVNHSRIHEPSTLVEVGRGLWPAQDATQCHFSHYIVATREPSATCTRTSAICGAAPPGYV